MGDEFLKAMKEAARIRKINDWNHLINLSMRSVAKGIPWDFQENNKSSRQEKPSTLPMKPLRVETRTSKGPGPVLTFHFSQSLIKLKF